MGSVASGVFVFVLNGSTALANQLASTFYKNKIARGVYVFLSHKWYFDTVYNKIVNEPLLIVAYHNTFSAIDKGVLELVGPTGFGDLSYAFGSNLALVQTGRVLQYGAFMVLTSLGFLFSSTLPL